LGFAPLPSGPDGAKPIVGQAAVVVFNASPNQAVAIDFLKFLLNEETAPIIAVLPAGSRYVLRCRFY
jgi:multiple sugar transport system substrate-binding protein